MLKANAKKKKLFLLALVLSALVFISLTVKRWTACLHVHLLDKT